MEHPPMSQPTDPNQTLDEMAQPNSAGDGAAQPIRCAATAGLELLEEIARGGMGAVLRGRDADIGRDVAVKVLLEAHLDRPELTRRFLEEARIAGRLQHPGVAPVYALGRMPDGRPLFTMKLIKGRTLTALLTERKDLAADRSRFLAVFEQVCQTLAYAHARGVIHRDLKPSNIMVGAYGEVQVMDWGLAKVLPHHGEAGEVRRVAAATEATSVIQTPRADLDTGEASDETQAGSVLGTPAYMAPEQARGEVEDVGVRSDVFGLGAILCEVLTRRPPFTGPRETALKQACRAELDDALGRLDGCGADQELIELTKRCLSADPAGRPSDAGEASAAVTAYRESVERRLRAAEVANAEAKVKAVEGRKRRRVALALAASVLLAATAAAAGAFWYHAEHTRRASATERDVTAALSEATALSNQGATLKDDPAKWEVALTEGMSAVKRAEGVLNSGEGTDELRQRIGSVRAELELAEKNRRMIVRLEEARLRNAEPGDAGVFDNAGSAALFAAAFKDEMGLDLQRFNPEEAAARIIGRAIRKELLEGLDDWLFVEHAEDNRVLILRILRAADPDATSFRNRLNAAVLANDRETLTAMATGDQERDLSPSNLLALGRAFDALGAETEALKLLRAGQSRFPTALWINFDLAQHLQKARPPAYEQSIRFYTVAAALNSGSAGIQNNLGVAMAAQEDWDGAIACYKKAIELSPKCSELHNNIGLALMNKGDLDGAAPFYKKAIELNPRFPEPHNNIGVVLLRKGDLDGAAVWCRKAIELNPKFTLAHVNLARVLYAQGNLADAIACYKKAIELDPNDDRTRSELVKVLAPLGRLEEVRAAWAAALEGSPPSHDAWFGYAELCLFLGREDEYQSNCRALLKRFGDTADPSISERVGKASLLLPTSGDDLDRAAALVDRAAAAGPMHPYYDWFMATKGLADYRRGRFDAAIDAIHQVGAKPAWADVTRPVLAMALYRSGRTREARETLAAAVQSYDWNETKADYEDKWIAHILRREAEELIVPNLSAFLKGEYQPKDNSERLELIDPCGFRKRYLSAARLYADALAADPKLADDALSGQRYNAACSAARAGCGQGEGANDLDAKERARWRKQALDWLRADLALLKRQVESAKPEDRKQAAETLRRWRENVALAGLREPARLAKLPADEQEAYTKFWADVKGQLNKGEARE